MACAICGGSGECYAYEAGEKLRARCQALESACSALVRSADNAHERWLDAVDAIHERLESCGAGPEPPIRRQRIEAVAIDHEDGVIHHFACADDAELYRKRLNPRLYVARVKMAHYHAGADGD